MNWREYTIIIMAVSSGIIIGWDIIVAFFNDVKDDTESEIIQGWFKNGVWPLAYLWGVLGGHFFMPGVLWTSSNLVSISMLVLITIILLVLGLLLSPRISHKRWRVAMRGLALLEFGILSGWLLWPQ